MVAQRNEMPFISDQLIKALEIIFPDKCPTLDLSEREIWFRVGQADVVRFLRQTAREQTSRTHTAILTNIKID